MKMSDEMPRVADLLSKILEQAKTPKHGIDRPVLLTHGQFISLTTLAAKGGKNNSVVAQKDEAIKELREAKDRAYTERNILAAIAAKLAIEAGFKAGLGKCDNEDWDDEWRNVVYIDLPNGQLSYHIAPEDLDVVSDLPKHDPQWDGKFNSKDKGFAKQALQKTEDVLKPKAAAQHEREVDVEDMMCEAVEILHKTHPPHHDPDAPANIWNPRGKVESDTTEVSEDYREAFEEWLDKKHLSKEKDLDLWGREKYKHEHIQAMFEGWEAAWKTLQKTEGV